PLYFFIFQEENVHKVFAGALFFGLIFSGYIFSITLFSFTWIPEAHLFSTTVKLVSLPIVLFASAITALAICVVMHKNRVLAPIERAVLFSIFAVAEWIIGTVFMGFNYGSLAYAASHLSALRFMASIGGTFLVTFVVVFGNAAFAEALRFLFQTKKRKLPLLIPLCIFGVVIGASFIYQRMSSSAPMTVSPSISVAVIQDQTRKESEAFGTVVQGLFQFPLLENHIKEALVSHPDIIIYPFSPWVGVVSDTLDNSGYTKNVIGMDFATFKQWLNTHLPPETTLVTWDTRLKDGDYLNEIAFWRGGVLVNSYSKKTLFPFMDYTPNWAQRLGLYSTPYDATAGTNTSPVYVGKAAIGSLVCSEDPGSGQENGKVADVVFAIGSEAMFTSSLASEFNLLNAQLRATESGRMFIRANRFGPSALIDTYGNIVKEAPLNYSGVFLVEVPVETEHRTVPYSAITEYPFIILLIGYSLLLFVKRSKN
ncbi:MAG: hypothetical protein Q7R59_01375, partial [bacterium]|nr:hypothetical protein [bacterium]